MQDSRCLSVMSERFALIPSTARYVRVVGYGTTASSWNAICEVEVLPTAVGGDE